MPDFLALNGWVTYKLAFEIVPGQEVMFPDGQVWIVSAILNGGGLALGATRKLNCVQQDQRSSRRSSITVRALQTIPVMVKNSRQ